MWRLANVFGKYGTPDIYINHEGLYSCSSGSLVSDPLNNVLNLGNGQVGVSRESEVENKLFALSKPIKATFNGKPFSFRCALQHTYWIRFVWKLMYEKTQFGT